MSCNNAVIRVQRVGNDYEEKATQFLGIYIDENLTWRHHIANINKIISSALFCINQVKHTLPKDCLRTIRQSDQLFEARYRTNFLGRLPLFNIPRIWNKWFHTNTPYLAFHIQKQIEEQYYEYIS